MYRYSLPPGSPSQGHTPRHGLGTLLVCGVAAVISVFVRLQSASGEKIQQIKWFAYAAAVLPQFVPTGVGAAFVG
jgi:hypothetical protein